MPFQRPTLAELVTRLRADFRARLELSGSLLRRAMADVLASVWSGATHLLHGHLEWLGDQLFVTSAAERQLLIRASEYGIAKTPATFAAGTVTATGADTTDIPMGTVYVRDDGATYTTTALATIAIGTATVSLQADEAGAAGDMGVGDTLTLQTPIAGIDSEATVILIDGGNDEETTEALRARLLLRLREPPQGGSEQDYKAWAFTVAGVTRVFVYQNENGLGTVVVRFTRDNDVSIFPDAGEVAAVQAAIDAEKPITADATAEAPTQLDVDITLSITPDTPALRTAVETEIDELITRDGEPGDGAGRGTILLSRLEAAVSNTPGITDRSITVPAADVVPAVGELPVIGTVTWV